MQPGDGPGAFWRGLFLLGLSYKLLGGQLDIQNLETHHRQRIPHVRDYGYSKRSNLLAVVMRMQTQTGFQKNVSHGTSGANVE